MMNTKTMEGLIGAGTNMNLLDTPMRVYKEARRKGDTAAMERAMGYVGDFAAKAEEYKAQADKGMEEEAKENRKKVEAEREEAVEKRRQERQKLEEQLAEGRKETHDADIVEISEEGRVLAESGGYTKTGQVVQPEAEQGAGISVSV
ncbi:MAG: hypothetical protein NC314_03110 [Roseburia sp.]|nr:hypothetical protein [Roseburia sp.]MCM1241804.1 hypothetical protein [Roseburia sp.]